MDKFQDSKEFIKAIKYLNNKNFNQALEIINSVSHKYPVR